MLSHHIPQSCLFGTGCAFPVFGETKGWWFFFGIVRVCILCTNVQLNKMFNCIDISTTSVFWFSISQGQSFIPMMMLLRELLVNLSWMIQQKFGLHHIIATLSNLNHNPSNIEVWSICWTCSSIIIRLTFFISFGQYEHAFCVKKYIWIPTKGLSFCYRHLTFCIMKCWIFHFQNCSSWKPWKLHSIILQRMRFVLSARNISCTA